ncbi:DUF4296 domain-containing protein [Marivirga salinae]|uniref:DUF4296 domain-containing protein n=1 Tax=Marivirga salinarum TaxID=3059078 RepID=A0AA49GG61_9BACT|nr:DUF4296 domain-containing protein [Marivirga sp. BDSF4-3]WKK74506.2 DUF4296 domain-containing protein [Marivirga sp. BDSF4-3]
MSLSVYKNIIGNEFDEANCNINIKMRKLIYIIAILTIVSCSGKEDRPKGVISHEKMALILSDIYLAEYKATHIDLKNDSAKEVLRHYELKIFEDHNTNDSIYKESFKYYLENPDQLETIYDIVIDTVSLREQVLNENKKRDKFDRQ